MNRPALVLTAIIVAAAAAPLAASPPEVLAATATPGPDGWTIAVTLRHPDSGWDHYASGWEVLDPDGARLGYRELAHPHVEEQPFTRSLSGIAIASGMDHVLIRPRCTLDGWVASPTRVNLRRLRRNLRHHAAVRVSCADLSKLDRSENRVSCATVTPPPHLRAQRRAKRPGRM